MTTKVNIPAKKQTKVKTVKKNTLKLQVVIKPGECGYYVAEVPVLPGCLSQGKSKEEAMTNIKEAAELYLETIGKSLPKIPRRYINEVEVTI